jgi:hypothetical protein
LQFSVVAPGEWSATEQMSASELQRLGLLAETPTSLKAELPFRLASNLRPGQVAFVVVTLLGVPVRASPATVEFPRLEMLSY